MIREIDGTAPLQGAGDSAHGNCGRNKDPASAHAVTSSLVLLRREPIARSGQRAGPRHARCPARGSGPTQARSIVPLFRPVPVGRTREDADGTSPTPSLGGKERDSDMAGSVNKVILIGNLGKDPEVRTTQAGSKIVSFTLATSETWNDRASDERKERTEWHRVVVFLCYREFATPGARDVGHPTADRRRTAGERGRGHGARRLGYPVAADCSRSA